MLVKEMPKLKQTPKPEGFETRIVTKFLWFPLSLPTDGQLVEEKFYEAQYGVPKEGWTLKCGSDLIQKRWLETVTIEQQLAPKSTYDRDHWGWFVCWFDWKDLRFVTDQGGN